MLKICVLGSGAGGGFPQWNCRCPQCAKVREGHDHLIARTQSSIAVSEDGRSWVLLNASPDIRQQLQSNPQFHPQTGLRHSPIKAVMLVDAHIDHTTGLLLLREGERLPLYCTRAVHDDLTTSYPIITMLSHFCGVDYHPLENFGEVFQIDGFKHLEFQVFALSGKAPPYSTHRENPREGDNIAVLIRDKQSGKSVFYAPGLADCSPTLTQVMQESDVVMVDGTFWLDDEMVTAHLSTKYSQDMGHMPLMGEVAIVPLLETLEKPRKILIHINNTNPILDMSSGPYRLLREKNIEVSYDGMEINLC
jgi:pyrroloquinoline quinone biosynthesis protein B